jgi:tyrosine-protein phosphatase SIW14
MGNTHHRRAGLLLLAGIFFLLGHSQVEARGLPVQEGILNFGKVSETLYRGAQPDAAGIASLKRLGIKLIVNLRMTDDVWKGEEAEAQSHGILYTNIPLRGMGRPTDEQIGSVLKLFETVPGPVFIHCRHGCDRTGTIIACYRIKHDRWTREKALGEAVYYGLSRMERGMKKYVVDFARSSSELARK